MPTDIVVPALGESVSEATVAQWLKKPGEAVAMDEAIVELETDKVTLEVNASEAGVLAEIVAAEGDNVEVGALLGRIGEGGGAAAEAPAPAAKSEPATPPAAEAAPAAPSAPTGGAVNGGEAVDVIVPTLGESVTEATIAQWMKKVGDPVAADEALVELETDKVTLEVNSPSNGTLTSIVAEEGATVGVAAILGVVTAGGAGASAPAAASAPATPAASAPAAAPAASSPAVAPASDLDPGSAPRSGSNGGITKADVVSFLTANTPPAAMTLSPAVRKLIDENHLNPGQIKGTGKDGRITKDDVLAFMANPPAPPAAVATAPVSAPAAATPAAGAREERVKMTKLRKTIARRLKDAQNTAAMLTTFNEVDMSAVMALRAQYKEGFEKKHGVKLGFSSFFTKAVVAALQALPAVNARIDGEEIVYNHFYDVGMAVSTPNGLMVPVMRDCDQKSFADIEKSLGELAKKGRDGKLSMDEMSGGTFTITNGGVFGSMMSTPILNMPQSAILGLHKIQERPMAVNGQVEIRPMMYLALSYDHRIIDGREAVTFLVKVKEAIEDPQRLLLDM
ncbi:2-oxoglutarate dehydrogenase complex dihydrolipoyllysine-residue succinyltransferase [Denitrobaculum tricleocarpae]|uniref:Dihydrolipoyllysine-residue succinyltransferase n=1 Tax=Denitrobaculum tricleocarpae TaxID=2591009 RepID=A0A545TQS1_9PROT|nr:2-oxoglutarate dehydrogenase complex dihydrolipoyllysine-residue succinyltransferase [Denitrobaculum tricleocarpae]TQV79573.1 2-oxoglutarate dehydrogenase complex dihydrolipoyllysine-residue succinyltransferase [Denitrobaculum tricleocarpae]